MFFGGFIEGDFGIFVGVFWLFLGLLLPNETGVWEAWFRVYEYLNSVG